MGIYQKHKTAILLGTLLVIVLCGFLLLLGANWFFDNQLLRLEQRVVNEQARIELGESIIHDLLLMETDFYQLIITRHKRVQQTLSSGIEERIEGVCRTLTVLQNGGTTVIISIHLLADDIGDTRRVTYTPDYSQVYYPEIIALRSKLFDLENDLDQILEVLKLRNSSQLSGDPIGLDKAMKMLLPFLKKSPPFFVRTKKNASRLYENSAQSMQVLQETIKARKQWYFYSEVFLVLLIILLIIVFGFVTSKRIHAISCSLASAKQEAEFANKAKSVFLANISHEFRTPLNSLLGYTQILSRDKSLGKKQLDSISVIHQSGDQLLTLLNNILQVSTIEAEDPKLRNNQFDLILVLEILAGIISVQATHKGLSFHYEPPKMLPGIVCGDETRLRLVLLNLLNNSLRRTECGCVVFRVENKETNLKDHERSISLGFSIEDTGTSLLHVKQSSEDIEGDLEWSISQQFTKAMDADLCLRSPAHIAEDGSGYGNHFWFDVIMTIPGDEVLELVCGSIPEKDIAPGPNCRAGGREVPIVVPPEQDLRALLELSRCGDISKLNQRVEEIAAGNPDYKLFVERIQHYAKSFSMSEIERIITECLDEH